MQRIILILFMAAIFSSCNENSVVQRTEDRLIYFTVDDVIGEGNAGLYKYSIALGASKVLIPNSFHNISRITQERKFILEKYFINEINNNIEVERFVKLMDETVTILPSPPPPENGWSVSLTEFPHAASAYNGRYFLYGGIGANPDVSPGRRSYLVLYDWAESSYDFLLLDGFIKENSDLLGSEFARPQGDFFGLSEDGSHIYFVLKTDSANEGTSRFALCSWSQDSIRIEYGPTENDLSISGYDSATGSVILNINGDIKTYVAGEIAENILKAEDIYSPNQIVPARSEMVVATASGIELVRPGSGERIAQVISFDEFDSNGEYSREKIECVISPDAKVIAFFVHKIAYSEGLYDMFIVDRDGSGLTKVVERKFITDMAISLPYELDEVSQQALQ